MRHILFFLLSLSSFFIATAWAEPIPPHIGEWNFTDSLSYYRTAGNYSNNYPLSAPANSGDLPNNGYLSTLTDTVAVNYDAFKFLRLNANFSYNRTTISGANQFLAPVNLTASGMSDAGLGAQYWFRSKRWALVPTLTGGIPFYRNSETQTGAMLGNGTSWIEGGTYGILYYFPVAVYGYAGYRYQDSGQAGLANLELGGSYRLSRARLRVGVRGETTVANDKETGNPFYRNQVLANVDAASLHFYSVNPTLFDVYAEGDWLFTRMWEAGLGFSQSVYGINTAVGWTVTAMIRFRLPGGDSRHSVGSQQDYLKPAISEPIFEPKGTEDDNIDPTPRGAHKKSLDKMLKDTEKSLDN